MENTWTRESLLCYNLQFFAKDGPGGEKTEAPTAKKLSDARKEGQVAKSKELSSAVSLIALFLLLRTLAASIGIDFIEVFSDIYHRIPDYTSQPVYEFNTKTAASLMTDELLRIIIILIPIFIVGVIVSFLSDIVQVKWKPTSKPLQPKLSKIDPLKGFKKIVSPESLMELLKAVLKVGVISYVVYDTLKDKMSFIYMLYEIPLMSAIGLIGGIVIDLGLKISIIYAIIGVGDYIFQKIKFNRDMKMTKQEVKDEFKNSEGNPEIKGKIKGKMREISRQRMMQQVPTADVIITNPTHFAVAIKYDAGTSKAPVVLAKGEDYLAGKIKEIAKENKIEIVENKPLARMLYYNVDIGAEVPPELYQAVAEVLAYVYSLKA